MNILDLGLNDIIEENKYITNDDMLENVVNYNLPWIEKYRPNTFEEIVSHNDILNALLNLIKNNSLPHLIFYGPSGTGKTTTVMACAKKLYGSNYKNMILELNGSDDRGINVVREQIKEFSMSKQFIGNLSEQLNNHIKLVILDEADSMTYDAQFALRRVIENYTYNTRFCLICNYENKIITALKSRCVIFRFSPIPFNKHLEKIKYICSNEQINMSDDAYELVIKLSKGDMRQSINLLQCLKSSLNNLLNIEINDVLRQIGYPLIEDKNNIIKIILNKNILLEQSIFQVNQLKLKYGLTTSDILKEISDVLIKKINNKNMINICKILEKISEIEIFMSISYNDTIALSSIISTVRMFYFS
jgi:replication factor C subunit 3/5